MDSNSDESESDTDCGSGGNSHCFSSGLYTCRAVIENILVATCHTAPVPPVSEEETAEWNAPYQPAAVRQSLPSCPGDSVMCTVHEGAQ